MFGLPVTDRFIFVGGAPTNNPPSGHYFLYIDGATGLTSKDDAGTEKIYRQNPSASSNDAIARFDGVLGAIQNSSIFIEDGGNVGFNTNDIASWPATLYYAIESIDSTLLFGRTDLSARGYIALWGNVYRDGGGIKHKKTGPASRYEQVDGGHNFTIAPSASTDTVASFASILKMDNDGIVGIDTDDLEAWSNAAVEFGRGGSVSFREGGSANPPFFRIMNNAYNDGSFKYKTTGTAVRFDLTGAGDFQFHVAPSGTADDPITWEEILRITNAGNVLFPSLPSTDPGVSGAIYYDPADGNTVKYSP